MLLEGAGRGDWTGCGCSKRVGDSAINALVTVNGRTVQVDGKIPRFGGTVSEWGNNG